MQWGLRCAFEKTLDNGQFWFLHIRKKRDPPLFEKIGNKVVTAHVQTFNSTFLFHVLFPLVFPGKHQKPQNKHQRVPSQLATANGVRTSVKQLGDSISLRTTGQTQCDVYSRREQRAFQVSWRTSWHIERTARENPDWNSSQTAYINCKRMRLNESARETLAAADGLLTHTVSIQLKNRVQDF